MTPRQTLRLKAGCGLREGIHRWDQGGINYKYISWSQRAYRVNQYNIIILYYTHSDLTMLLCSADVKLPARLAIASKFQNPRVTVL